MPSCLWSNFDTPSESSPILLDDLSVDVSVGMNGHLEGGAGGVWVLKTPEGARYTIKTSSHPTALKDEMFADAVYQLLGLPVPRFAAFQSTYNDLPPALKAIIPRPVPETDPVLFRLADYIDGNKALTDDRRQVITEKLPEGFVVDCFLANHDVAGHWQNVVVDEKEEVWRIDNGSTLRFRARGGMKQLSTVVSELTTMQSETEMMKVVFAGIPVKKIQQQVKILLANRNTLIKLFFQMHEKISFDQPEMLFNILVNRLQYLHEHVSEELYPYAPALSEACVDYTEAGTLLIAENEGKKQVLLGKRTKHNWWGSFGGATEERDLFLRDTAARKSNEELIGVYKILAGELDTVASHDLILEEQLPLNVRKLRMYFVERERVPETDFRGKIVVEKLKGLNPEHDEFMWVPVESLLTARTVIHHDDKYGDHETLEVTISGAGRTTQKMFLHPLFGQMLQQAAVQSQLIRLSKGEALEPHHTRSRVSATYPTVEVLDVSLADVTTLSAEREQLARVTVRRGLMNREFLATQQKKVAEVKVQSDGATQTDIYFRAIMEDKFQEQKTQEEKVDTFDRNYKQLPVEMREAQRHQFATMLEEEAKHPKQAVFYHAAQAEIAFLYDVFTEFRRQLEHQYKSDFVVLRAFDDFFEQFGDVLEFMAAYSENATQIDNYAKDYQEMGLSVNPFLFGSDGNQGSASYYYFLQGKSAVPPNIEKLFHYFVSRLQIDIDFAIFDHSFKMFREKAGGVCYQLFVDNTCVDQVAYPAKAGGAFNPLVMEQGEIRLFSEVLEELRKNPVKHVEYIKRLQGRLYLKPEIFHSDSVEIRTYQAAPLSPEEMLAYQRALSEAVGHCVTQLLANYRKLPAKAFARGTPNLHKQMGEIYKHQSRLSISEVEDIKALIPAMLAEANVVGLIELIANTKNVDLSQRLLSRNYIRSSDDNTTVTLLGTFNKNSAVARQVFAALQALRAEPHIKTALTQLCQIVMLDMIAKKQVAELFELIATTSEFRVDHVLIPFEYINGIPQIHEWQDVFYQHSDVARLIFTKLRQVPQQEPHLLLLMNMLKPFVIYDMVAHGCVLSELVTLIVTVEDLQLTRFFKMWNSTTNVEKVYSLRSAFEERLGLAEAVFSELKRMPEITPQTAQALMQLQPIAWHCYVSRGDLTQIEMGFSEMHDRKNFRLYEAIGVAAAYGSEQAFDWLITKCGELNYPLLKQVYGIEEGVNYEFSGESALVRAVKNGHTKIVYKIMFIPGGPFLTPQQFEQLKQQPGFNFMPHSTEEAAVYFDDLLRLAAKYDRSDIIALALDRLLAMPSEVYEDVLIHRNKSAFKIGSQSILFYLAEKGPAEVLERILAVGAMSELVGILRRHGVLYGDDLFAVAIKNHQQNIVKILLRVPSMCRLLDSYEGRQNLLLAVRLNNAAIINLFLPVLIKIFSTKDSEYKNALMIAAENGNVQLIMILLSDKNFCSSNIYNICTKTRTEELDALGLAAKHGNLEVVQALLTQHFDNSTVPELWDYRRALQVSRQAGHEAVYNYIVNSKTCSPTVLDVLIILEDKEAIQKCLPRISTLETFIAVMDSAEPMHRTEIYELLKNSLPTMLEVSKLYRVVKYLTPAQCNEVCRRKITTAEEFYQAMLGASEMVRASIYDAVRDKLSQFINSLADIEILFRKLNPAQRNIIFEAVSPQNFAAMISSSSNFIAVLLSLSSDQVSKVCQELLPRINTVITSVEELRRVLCALTPEKCIVVCQALLPQINSILKTSIDVSELLSDQNSRILSNEQCCAVCQGLLPIITDIIIDYNTLNHVLNLIITSSYGGLIFKKNSPDRNKLIFNEIALPIFYKNPFNDFSWHNIQHYYSLILDLDAFAERYCQRFIDIYTRLRNAERGISTNFVASLEIIPTIQEKLTAIFCHANADEKKTSRTATTMRLMQYDGDELAAQIKSAAKNMGFIYRMFGASKVLPETKSAQDSSTVKPRSGRTGF